MELSCFGVKRDLMVVPMTSEDQSGKRRAYGQVALIEEALCVGCVRCIEVCPVDAIVGARNLMHTVIASECIGCRLCLAPCPVDCITMIPTPEGVLPKTKEELQRRAALAKSRYRARQSRLRREKEQKRARLEARKTELTGGARS